MDAAAPRVLVIGLDPHRVPGDFDPEPVATGIEIGLAKFVAHGLGVEACLVGLDGSDDARVELLEWVVNLVRRRAPDAAIAFNGDPATTYEAAARWIDDGE